MNALFLENFMLLQLSSGLNKVKYEKEEEKRNNWKCIVWVMSLRSLFILLKNVFNAQGAQV